MENNTDIKTQSLLERLLDHKAIVFILFGIIIRLFMLLFYYYTHAIDPSRNWGDVDINFNGTFFYTPLTMMLLDFFSIFSFGMVEIFAFWAFLLDLLITLMFYFVLKSFEIPNMNYAFGLFLINPFIFLNNSFSLENCGYHITDSFFFFFLFMALIFYPRKEVRSRYLFYIFLALSIVTKLYTLPVVGFFFLKFVVEKNWREMKIFLIATIPIIFIFLVLPSFYYENYLDLFLRWNQKGEVFVPLYLRLIPLSIIIGLYIIFRLKKADLFEILFVSIFFMVYFLFFSNAYIRYFQPLLLFGILKQKEFFTFKLNLGFIERDIKFDNNLLVFYLSFILVGIAYLMIIFNVFNIY